MAHDRVFFEHSLAKVVSLVAPWQLVLLLGIVIFIAGFYRPRSRGMESTGELLNGMEETLNQFTQELEEDNQRLLREFSGMKAELENRQHQLLGRIELLEKQVTGCLQASSAPNNAQPGEQTEQVLPEDAASDLSVSSDQADSQAEEIATIAGQNIKERYNHIFSLHQSGKSIDQISKKLGITKGEVQLIIRLAKQEEQFRA